MRCDKLSVYDVTSRSHCFCEMTRHQIWCKKGRRGNRTRNMRYIQCNSPFPLMFKGIRKPHCSCKHEWQRPIWLTRLNVLVWTVRVSNVPWFPIQVQKSIITIFAWLKWVPIFNWSLKCTYQLTLFNGKECLLRKPICKLDGQWFWEWPATNKVTASSILISPFEESVSSNLCDIATIVELKIFANSHPFTLGPKCLPILTFIRDIMRNSLGEKEALLFQICGCRWVRYSSVKQAFTPIILWWEVALARC